MYKGYARYNMLMGSCPTRRPPLYVVFSAFFCAVLSDFPSRTSCFQHVHMQRAMVFRVSFDFIIVKSAVGGPTNFITHCVSSAEYLLHPVKLLIFLSDEVAR